MFMFAALLCLFFASAHAFYGGIGNFGYPGYGGFPGYGGYPGYGYGGFGVAEIVEPVAPIIPVSSGLVGERSFVDSFIPGSSYCGFGTYGPAYGGLPYPLEAFGPVGYGGPLLGGFYR